ncbi:hypothetical protein KR084_006443 [Drosophila pseudotakahashii]|nr:hypothetical protein KR084_006443 [Drosophila pseudotakahashii]
MKFLAILILLCGIVGFASSSTTTTSSSASTTSTTTSAPVAEPPCGSDPEEPCGQIPPPLPPYIGGLGGPSGKKLYYFFK